MAGIDVKICGLTNRDDALAALEMGADFLGFVLYAGSPRGISVERLLAIRERLPESARAVGVFVNAPGRDVAAVVRHCRLYAAQIHGDERAGDFRNVPFRVWRAVKVDADAFVPSPEEWCAERFVVEARVEGRYGGTGVTADWAAAGRFAEAWPTVLAGGLTPQNVGNAIYRVRPLGVDVAGGVERRPGVKDWPTMRDFIARARAAAATPGGGLR